MEERFTCTSCIDSEKTYVRLNKAYYSSLGMYTKSGMFSVVSLLFSVLFFLLEAPYFAIFTFFMAICYPLFFYYNTVKGIKKNYESTKRITDKMYGEYHFFEDYFYYKSPSMNIERKYFDIESVVELNDAFLFTSAGFLYYLDKNTLGDSVGIFSDFLYQRLRNDVSIKKLNKTVKK